MDPIPTNDYTRFKAAVEELKRSCYLEFFAENPSVFQIKKEKTIRKNLEGIFAAVLKISNQKGFHAMTMRDLSREAKLSTGALYNYFSGKEDLLEMMQNHRRTITRRVLRTNITAEKEPLVKLRAAIRTHLYLSEAMQPWFFFSYMEAKNIGPKQRRAAVQGELSTENIFTEILEMGRDRGLFMVDGCQMTASLIKAMLQDWYLKRNKYAGRNVNVDAYACFLMAFIEKSIMNRSGKRKGNSR